MPRQGVPPSKALTVILTLLEIFDYFFCFILQTLKQSKMYKRKLTN